MRRFDPRAIVAAAALLLGSDAGDYAPRTGPEWSDEQIAVLQNWADGAAADALPRPDTAVLDAAIQRGNRRAIDQSASDLALKLAQAQLLGAASAAERADWHIADNDSAADLPGQLQAAIGSNRIDEFFAAQRPASPDYTALKAAYADATDLAQRLILARNMERWRWLPRALGDDYLLANAAGFEVTLWRSGKRHRTWVAISGKVKTPTPAISTTVVAVNFNPWWEVPESIARESNLSHGGSYVWTGKRFRQKPGPGNALGQMKLVMPNSYNIYLHDTPSRGLFGAETRAFSHGCIRVGDALGFASVLLEGAASREQINQRLKSAAGSETKTFVVSLPQPLPVYVAYFTAAMRSDGSVAFHKDIYGHDVAITSVAGGQQTRVALR